MKYRKKPVVVEAVRWNGCNLNEVQAFANRGHSPKLVGRRIRIKTMEGHIYADEGDFIIKGVQGECYPCKPDIFAATYDPVEDEAREDSDEQ